MILKLQSSNLMLQSPCRERQKAKKGQIFGGFVEPLITATLLIANDERTEPLLVGIETLQMGVLVGL